MFGDGRAILARSAIRSGSTIVLTWPAIVAPRPAVAEGWPAATVVTPRAPVATAIAVAEGGPILAWRGGGQRPGRGGFTLGGSPAEFGPWGGHDPCRFGAHAEYSAAAGCQDL
ncbi:MAG TPA: hypothetical protein VK656_04305, partial [Candidatus Acidoferrum sp.]|nr:hypothetical protein [Candidatus Acidoferrum sp.]